MATLDEIAKATTQRARLADYANALGVDELDVLLVVAEGLASGRIPYGELNLATDARDFVDEANAELRDAMVYLGAQITRLRRRSVSR